VSLAPAALACPIDGLPLATDGTTRRCPSGHTFDIAREGYCNLLLVQHKASLDPGDSKPMVTARNRFLEAGHFAPIANAVSACVLNHIAQTKPRSDVTLLDAGCGEGYYTAHLANQIAAHPARAPTVALVGIDVSKWAIRQAARRKQPITWLVANNARPPFAAGSVDLIVCLFGFPVWEGFSAVQSAGGHVVLIDPAPDHLIELRDIIYPTVTRQPTSAPTASAYDLLSEQSIRFTAHLPNAQTIQDLLTMTPHAHRITDAGRAKLAAHMTLDVTIDVVLRVVTKLA
jgi:23S rRNA (guanine745-N1)-methyltransferase